jgi:hypothetical protein
MYSLHVKVNHSFDLDLLRNTFYTTSKILQSYYVMAHSLLFLAKNIESQTLMMSPRLT